MSNKQLIEQTLNQFLIKLKDDGMMIVPADTYRKDMELKLLQDACLSQRALTCQQILNAKLLNVTSRNTLVNWTKNGTLKTGEFFNNSKGVLMILTLAVIRLRK